MNWGRAKTILIILFTAVNLVLLSTYMFLEYQTNNISEETIDSTIAALSAKGIYINRDIIRKEKYQDYCPEMVNIVGKPSETAIRFLGANYIKVSDSEYQSGTKVLTLSESHLNFEDRRDWIPFDKATDTSEMEDMCKQYLEGLGFDKNTYIMYNKKMENDVFSFQIMPRMKEYKIEGIHLKMKADKTGILHMDGCWFETVFFDTASKETFCDVTSVLLEFMYAEPNGARIVGIEGCYYIPAEFVGAKSFRPIPVYIISCEDKSVSIFSAKNAALILNSKSGE